jgi:hypothetical protein
MRFRKQFAGMTYDMWKTDYPTNDGPDDDSDWLSLVAAFEEWLDRNEA